MLRTLLLRDRRQWPLRREPPLVAPLRLHPDVVQQRLDVGGPARELRARATSEASARIDLEPGLKRLGLADEASTGRNGAEGNREEESPRRTFFGCTMS